MTHDFSPDSLVSVVIPCYNQAHYLGEAIASALKQTYRPIEIIVVDDGSSDHTPLVAKSFPTVRYVRQPNGGVASARNMGFAHTQGNYVLFLDADDRLLPTAVERGLDLLRDRQDCAFVFGGAYYVDDKIVRRDLHRFPDNLSERIYPQLLECNFIANPAMVIFHRWALTDVGTFKPAVSASADYELYLRMTWLYPVLHHTEPVMEYRRHGGNMSNDPCLMLRSTLTVMELQTPQLSPIPSLRDNYRRGLAFWRQYYGEQVVIEFYKQIRSGNLGPCLRCLRTLAQWYPARLAQPGTKMVQRLVHRCRHLAQ